MLTLETQRAVEAAIDAQDFDDAGRLAEAALGGGEVHPLLYLFAGLRRQYGGDARGALALLAEAVRLAPDDPQILVTSGDAFLHTGNLTAALTMFDRALAIDPMLVSAWYGRAQALDGAGRTEEALANFTRVTHLAPDTAPGHAGVALILAQLGRTAEARAAAERGLSIDRNDATSQIALARCDLADQYPEAAVARLQTLVLQPAVQANDRIVALALLGDALDRIDASADAAAAAFRAYAAAKAQFADVHAGPNAPPAHRTLVENVEAGVLAASAWPESARPRPLPMAAANHVFLLGYPRSGTTLAEVLLAATPGVATTEEEPTLAAVEPYLDVKGVVRLAGLDDRALDALRSDYWHRVVSAGAVVRDTTFVDMDPLKGLFLPGIARLFPQAKVVIVRRDPRDVVWSCFRRSFVYSPATYEFTTLQRAANHYDAMMRLIETCLDRLPIEAHILRYEALVEDFEPTTRALYEFVGLPWSNRLHRFDRTAKARSIKTRSAEQVRSGLFDGRGQWRRYASQMAPVLPILEHWAARFGYEV